MTWFHVRNWVKWEEIRTLSNLPLTFIYNQIWFITFKIHMAVVIAK